MSHTRTHRLVQIARRVLGLGAVTALVLADAGTADARINPYYVIESGAADNGSTSRILVLVDTSPTMALRADNNGDVCTFAECEDESSDGLSKIAAARLAMRTIVIATEGVAEFGFVGFQRHEVTGPNPGTCSGGDRFEWVTSFDSTSNGGPSQSITHHGFSGTWRLCDGHADHEGFPYVRYDQARFGVTLPDDLTTAVSTPVDTTDFDNAWHETRDVQYFDKFYGVRFQPDATQEGDSSGDYSSVDVIGETFYYWPYVDGFPGYTDFESASNDPMGINGEDNLPINPLELFGPFYVDPTLPLSPTYDGPASKAEARSDLLATLSAMPEGGVDLAQDTGWQWDNSVGSTNSAPLNSASIFSSTTLDNYMTWMTNALEAMDEGCGDLAIIIISDGINGWGGAAANQAAYTRLASLYEDLDVNTYVIGVNDTISTELNNLACAGSGACDSGGPGCSTPCTDDSPTDFETCQTPSAPGTDCVWTAENPDELATKFASIVAKILDVDVDSGQGAAINTFGTAGDADAVSQTLLRAYTEAGQWRGHVERGYCTDVDGDGNYEDYCALRDDQDGGTLSSATEFDLPDEAIDTSFGGCDTLKGADAQSRVWDAGECLQYHDAGDRRLYTHGLDHTLIEIQDGTGNATAEFQTELENLGLLTSGAEAAEANAIAQFVSGLNAPGDWKLPGLANSSPVVVKRVPEYDAATQPEVAIRDPHCGGRFYSLLDAGALPASLYSFAQDAWNEDTDADGGSINNAGTVDYAYQEAVLVGDDMGVLHAFQLDSGNELWGFVPRGVLANLAAQAANGVDNMGQPLDVEDHLFGVASTVNHAWVHDDGVDDVPNTADDDWVHLAVFGIGSGGSEYQNTLPDGSVATPNAGAEYYALDISHMHPLSGDGPFEILWSTEDTTANNDNDLKPDYDDYLGETWARPAITYWVPGEALENPPESYIVMGSGYRVDATAADQGKSLIRADALTGVIQETAQLPAYSQSVYESDFGTVVDTAVGSHCISRFWAEAQESYIADPAGRLFRWDLGRDTSHAADSGDLWSANNGDVAIAVDSATSYFPACTGASPCTVGSTASGDVGEPFVFAPAVSANDRIDDFSSVANGDNPGGEDQFLIALISGSPSETALDDNFHSSIYLLVDDHQSDPSGGFTIPAGAPKTTLSGTPGAGTSFADDVADNYFRIAVSDVERTRVITIDGDEVLNETANFSRRTLPIRAPRIVVTGVGDDSSGDLQVIEGLEVYFIEFTVYEPPVNGCNVAFVDDDDNEFPDLGSTYTLRFRLTADATAGFALSTGVGAGSGADFGAGFTPGLTLEDVEQLDTELEDEGNQGPKSSLSSGTTPCDPEDDAAGGGGVAGFAVPIRTSTVQGFSPIE